MKRLPEDRSSSPAPYYADYTRDGSWGLSRANSLLGHLEILRESKGLLVLFSFLGVLAAALYTLPQTRLYQARATIEIQPLNEDFLHLRDLSPTSGGLNASDPGWDLQTQVRILQTRALLNRVTSKMRLERKPPDTAPGRHTEPPPSDGGVRPRPSGLGWWRSRLGLGAANAGGGYESAIRAAADGLHVRAQANTRLIEILCDSPDPGVASDFANTLASEFIEQNLEARWQTTRHTGEWLARQMQDVKIKLESSEAELQSFARQNGLLFTGGADNADEQKLKQLQDELSKAKSDRIARQSRYELATQAAADSLGEVLDDTSLKDLQGKLAELRRQLAELNTSFTPVHPRVTKAEAQIAALETAAERQRANILRRIRNDFESAQRREKLLASDYSAAVEAFTAQAAKVTHYNILKREVDTNRQLYENMLQRVKEAGIASALRASNVRVVDPAAPPQAPYEPSYVQNGVLGFLGGFVGGIVFVLFRARGDRTVHRPGDAGQFLGVRELGIVHSAPSEPKALPFSSTELISLNPRPSIVSESVRATVASILFTAEGSSTPRVLVLSSASPKEGKTTLASNLAISLAEIHRKVLLIDADLRRPRLHRIFEFENDRGLIDLLRPQNGLVLEDIARPSGVPNLSVVTSGNAGERDPVLLHSARFAELVGSARAAYDIVLIDTPPLLGMADARIVARHSDGVILVARARRTPREVLKEACDRLTEDGTQVLGAVLNDWNSKRSSRHYRY
jgi:capsular exopolysaccharide synthesis family protein